jgi:hypothetical protein
MKDEEDHEGKELRKKERGGYKGSMEKIHSIHIFGKNI